MLLKQANRQKRRWRRSSLHTPVRILTGKLLIDGLGINVSEGGMYFFAVANLAMGETVQVEFTNPGSQQLVRVFGTVRSRAVYLYGLEFVPSEFSRHLDSPQPTPWSSPANLPD